MTSLIGLLLAVLLVFAGEDAFAQLVPQTVAVAQAASGQIIGEIAAQPEAPPRIGDQKSAQLFALALPVKAVETAKTAKPREFPLLMDASAMAGAIARAYLLAGIATDNSGVARAALSTEQRQQARENFVLYLAELESIYDFRLLTCARLADGVATFLDRLPPAERPGMESGRRAIETEILSVLAATLSLVADHNVEDNARIGRMQLLTETTPRFARFLGLKQSEIIADQALAAAVVETNPVVAAQLKNFALAILR